MISKLLGEPYWAEFDQFLKEIELLPYSAYNGVRDVIDLTSDSFIYKSAGFFTDPEDASIVSLRDISDQEIAMLKKDIEENGFSNLKESAIKECEYFLGLIEAVSFGESWTKPKLSPEAHAFLSDLKAEENVQELVLAIADLSSLYSAIQKSQVDSSFLIEEDV